MMRTIFVVAAILSVQTLGASFARAQAVAVTMRLDVSRIAVDEATTLHVFAQVVPGQRAASDRIFSWYVDLLNSQGAVAQANYSSLQKPTSDKDPKTSSAGATDGFNRRGIYDTFINRAGAGVSEPVELFSVPIAALAPGRATFRVSPGTGQPLSADFLVAPKGGGNPLTGGNYDAASIELEVVPAAACTLKLALAHAPVTGGKNKLTLTFPPCAGKTHFVEFRDKLNTGSWQTLPAGPHNTGTVTDTNSVPGRFYRVRIQ